MTENIFWIVEADVLDGKAAAIRSLATELTAQTRTEPGAIAYEWSFSPDGSKLYIYERYADADAALAHLANVGGRLPELFALCTPLAIHGYGKANEAFREAVANMPVIYNETFEGFHR